MTEVPRCARLVLLVGILWEQLDHLAAGAEKTAWLGHPLAVDDWQGHLLVVDESQVQQEQWLGSENYYWEIVVVVVIVAAVQAAVVVLPVFVFFLTTHGALPNTYNNNNNSSNDNNIWSYIANYCLTTTEWRSRQSTRWRWSQSDTAVWHGTCCSCKIQQSQLLILQYISQTNSICTGLMAVIPGNITTVLAASTGRLLSGLWVISHGADWTGSAVSSMVDL